MSTVPNSILPDPRQSSIGQRLRSWLSRAPRSKAKSARTVFVVLALAAGLVLGAAIACLWRPDALAALTLIPAWWWLVGGFASAVPVWQANYRRLACGLAVLWLLFAIGWVDEFPSLLRSIVASDPSGHAERPLRIVSLHCANSERALVDLERLKPDVVLLQESPGKESLARMSQRLFGSAGGFLSGNDTAILARGKVRAHFINVTAHFVIGTVVFADGRKVTCVSLRLIPPVSRLDFWNPGFWSDHRELRDLHRRQLREITERIAKLPSVSALVVGGDFNTVPLDRSLEELSPRLADAFDLCGVGWGATGTNDWPLFRVDQIWTDSQLVPISVMALKTESSDHRMVVCDTVRAE